MNWKKKVMKNIHKSWIQFHKLQNRNSENSNSRSWLSLVSDHSKSWENQGYPQGEDWKYVSFGDLPSFPLSLPLSSSQNQQYQDSRFFVIQINDFSYPTQLKQETSCPEGLEVKTHLQELDSSKDSPLFELFGHSSTNGLFAQSALSFMGSGLILRLKPGVVLEKPVKIIFNMKSGNTFQDAPKDSITNAFYDDANDSEKLQGIKSREIKEAPFLNVFNLFIDCGPRAEGQVFIDFQGQSLDGLSNFRLDVNMDEKSCLDLFTKEKGSSTSYFVYNLQAHLQRKSQLKVFDFTLSSLWTRHNLQVNLEDKEAGVNMKGIYVNHKNYFSDHHISVNHQVGETTSVENYRGILSGQARGVFNGRVYIAPDASGSQSEQVNKNLMLSNQAEINAKPELQIYNDEVKATHGATVGQLNEEQGFYLKSRGYTPEQALKSLSKAFVFDLVNEEKSHVKDFYLSDLDETISCLGET